MAAIKYARERKMPYLGECCIACVLCTGVVTAPGTALSTAAHVNTVLTRLLAVMCEFLHPMIPRVETKPLKPEQADPHSCCRHHDYLCPSWAHIVFSIF